MKRIGKLCSLALVLLFLLALMPAPAIAAEAAGEPETLTEGCWSFTVDGGKATVTGYSGNEDAETVPSMLGGYPVTAIGDEAFYDYCIFQSLSLPAGLETIGNAAFYGCYRLTDLTIPSSVRSIGEEAFAGNCVALKSINVESGSSTFSSVGGVLFSKDKTLIISFTC